jgi:enamine deaminase RidA (YjgF/YER057c/UK114 family)
MPHTSIIPDKLPKPIGPYSHVAIGQGAMMVIISGQVPVDASAKTIETGNNVFIPTKIKVFC